MDPIITKAKDDLADINEQVRSLLEKKKKLESFLTVYDELAADDKKPPKEQNTLFGDFGVKIVPKGDTAKERITSAVAEILSDGSSKSTRALLEILKPAGLEPGATDKVIGLSNLLSRDDRFMPDRTHGWSLKK
jgi:hypothetical protein